jgi:hypothetical protein
MSGTLPLQFFMIFTPTLQMRRYKFIAELAHVKFHTYIYTHENYRNIC